MLTLESVQQAAFAMTCIGWCSGDQANGYGYQDFSNDLYNVLSSLDDLYQVQLHNRWVILNES
ncbi:hypothetical protein [Candidatus Vondammii sp. HM_W22]|uniref:hypothetical protein n=1 Tax=Candidatus Vondammii sp. HM_W22 TaxID=2687299 RepID=UPI001F1494A5|nr:hypothetical protein [Candidatus Vondammii sp. HM_W22]